MSLHLFDTATRSVREFTPLTPGKVGIYLCGATVQSSPHIGHVRTVVAFDVLVRWLRRSGLDVTVVRNVTDIDDKILNKSAAAGKPWWQWATTYDREFTAAYDALGALPPEHEPRATGHITDMIELVVRLIEAGHAYTTTPGNVYFDVRSWPEYGALTNQRLADLAPANDSDGSGKRDPRDFALWKAPREGEPETAAWDAPFGRGRPGWHLECSAMATRYLGQAFDIHGGGLDLRFPHHENEQAQSRAAGDGFAQYWLHSAWVTQGGTKMSKSLGNGLLVSEVLQRTRPAALRYALTAVHYRSMLEWTDSTLGEVADSGGQDTLVEAETIWERLAGFVARAQERVGVIGEETLATYELPAAFVTAMNDDLNVPSALAVVHEHLRAGNTALATSDDQALAHHVTVVRAMLDVLGLDPAGEKWGQTHADDGYRNALATLIEARLQERSDARVNRDFATADAIRDSLAAAGIIIEDSPAGVRWTLNPDQAG